MPGPRLIAFLSVCVVVSLMAAKVEATTVGIPAPYEARVVATGAPVHSGPGADFYPTDTLAQGDVVEVYDEKPDGWLAIRPPVHSFSWVAARDLRVTDGGTEVVTDGAASRIGSRLSNQRNAAQVRLKKGEMVEVLDEQTIDNEKWYKILPPDGEFRWIQATLVERVGNIQLASAEGTASTADAPRAKETGAPPMSGNEPIAATPASTSPSPSVSSTPLPTTAGSTSTPSQTVGTAEQGDKLRAAPNVADELSRELTAIELRLSRMVAAPINLWNTERLERDATQLLSRAQTMAQRDAVQATLNKIRQFSTIGARANQLPPVATRGQSPVSPVSTPNPVPAAAGLPMSAASASPPPDTAASPIAGPPGGSPAGSYDAVGILRPVVSRRPGAPQFALVDERGQVLSFVTPSPDVNLQPYLGRRVGVLGNRGYISEFNRTHVTAARVAPLAERVLR